MHARPDWVWSLAERFKIDVNQQAPTQKIKLVQEFLRLEFGPTFPLVDLISYGIGVHHAGLSDDVRTLMEWLFEEKELRFLVATTTIAQGVDFPIFGRRHGITPIPIQHAALLGRYAARGLLEYRGSRRTDFSRKPWGYRASLLPVHQRQTNFEDSLTTSRAN